VPLFWEQSSVTHTTDFTREPPLQRRGFAKHEKDLLDRYNEFTFLSLLHPKKEQEKSLIDALLEQQAIFEQARHDQPRASGVLNFDLHSALEEEPTLDDVSALLRAKLEPKLNDFGFFDEAAGHVQTGVFRSNCLDCLDRTSIAQFLIAWTMVERYCESHDLDVAVEPPATGWTLFAGRANTPAFKAALMNVWADTNDCLALQYAGTRSTFGSVLRSGDTRGSAMALERAAVSMNRYYVNNFEDSARQECVEVFLGKHPLSAKAEDRVVPLAPGRHSVFTATIRLGEFDVGDGSSCGTFDWIPVDTDLVVLAIFGFRMGVVEAAVRQHLPPGRFEKVGFVQNASHGLLVLVRADIVGSCSHVRLRAEVRSAFAPYGICCLSVRMDDVPYTFCSVQLAGELAEERAEQLEQLFRAAFPLDVLRGRAWVIGNLRGDTDSPQVDRKSLSRPGSPENGGFTTQGSCPSDCSSWVLWEEDEFPSGVMRLVPGYESFAEPVRRFPGGDSIFVLHPSSCAEYRARDELMIEGAESIFADAPVSGYFPAGYDEPRKSRDMGDGSCAGTITPLFASPRERPNSDSMSPHNWVDPVGGLSRTHSHDSASQCSPHHWVDPVPRSKKECEDDSAPDAETTTAEEGSGSSHAAEPEREEWSSAGLSSPLAKGAVVLLGPEDFSVLDTASPMDTLEIREISIQ
jgi:hypothetical protein